MKIESWQEKFYRLAELYLNTDAKYHLCLGKTHQSELEIFKEYVHLSESQQEALKNNSRGHVSRIINSNGEGTPTTKPVKHHNIMEMRKQRKSQIAKKVLELED